MKAIIDGNTLKTVITAFAAKLKTATMSYDEDGLKIEAMDQDGLILVKYEVPQLSFRDFEVEFPGSLEFDLKEFGHAITRATSGNYATLTHDVKRERLGLTFEGSLGSWKTFEFPVTTPKSPPKRLDDEGFTVKLSIDPDVFLEVIKDTRWMADTLILDATFTEGEVGFNVYAGKNDGVTAQTELNSRTWHSLEVSVATRAQYALKYLAPFAKLASCALSLQVEFRRADFLRLEYRIIDAAGQTIRDMGTVTCMIAPQGETGFIAFAPDPGQTDLLRFCEEAIQATQEGDESPPVDVDPEAAGDAEPEAPAGSAIFAQHADVLGVPAADGPEVAVDEPAGADEEDEE